MTLLAYDRAASDRTIDESGRLHVANCPISKAAVNPYYGAEIPGWMELGLVRDRRYMLLRPPEELEKAAETFNNVQVLDEHTPVHADNNGSEPWCGTVSGVFFDGTYLRAGTLTVWTTEAIAAVESEEKCELSSSYAYTPIMEAGIFEGLRYDGRMINIVGNHVALVEEGRAGPDVHVSDALPKGFRMKKSLLLRTVRGLANDADIDAAELVAMIAAAGATAEDEDLNDDPNVMDAMPENAMSFLRGKLSEDDMAELAGCFGKPAADEEPDDDDSGADDEKDDSDGASDATPKPPKPARRPVAMDAAAIRSAVIADISAWNTACDKVAPHIGKVQIAMDAAPDGARGLYRKALDAHNIDHKGVNNLTALERMVDMLPTRTFANDAAHGSDPSPLDAVLEGVRPVHRS